MDLFVDSLEIQRLTDCYLQNKVVTDKSWTDASYVAYAAVYACAGLVSWNYKHIVHEDKCMLFNVVNASQGYPPLFIATPKEILTMPRKDKYACFQWIRDIRAKMNTEMEHMTPEERVAYMHAGAEAALSKIPKLSLDEARRQRRAILHPEETPIPPQKAKAPRSRKASSIEKPARQRTTAKRLTHA